jgi:uncharacterized protein (TIGR02231 family)
MAPPPMAMSYPLAKKSAGLPGMSTLAGLADGLVETAAAVYRGAGGGSMDRDEGVAGGEAEAEVGDGWLDFDGLELGAPGGARRGKLVPRPDSVAQDRRSAVGALESLSPSRVSDVRATRGQFDHRYVSEGRAEVPSDGQTHRLSVAIKPGEPQLRFRAVPREDPQVFREVELKNPAEAPLLSGPVDVYVEGSLLTTSDLSYVDRGGLITVGMGVEERVRVARNVRADEESAGLLGGSTVMTHTVTLEVSSSLPAPARLELLDRVPVTDDKTIEVKLLSSAPEAEPYKQEDRGHPMRGGLRWRLTLAPGEKRTVEFKYKVTFNAKDELVGGNRRD